MAKTIEYKVSLTPAKFDDRGCVSFLLFDPGTKDYTVAADSLARLQGDVRALVVNDFKQSAACYVRLAERNARKPAGFDKATREIQTLRYVAPAEG
jgi:hypothetical protein